MTEADVAIIGGGPAGSTLGCLLKKYAPDLDIAIFERESFPRDHVGESQLPPISHILDEMGCWEKVEGANFPIKIGATYRWGKFHELWNVDFAPSDSLKNETRPGVFNTARQATAFQVDRSVYDKILLDHARSLGCRVFEETKVLKIAANGDSVLSISLESGETVTARYYIDASGHSGILRRAMGSKVEYPTTLQNVAIWEYWRNAEWAVDFGIGATRIQVMSLPYGWLWFIPLGPDRTSVGLVLPADYMKKNGRKPEEIYSDAIQEDDLIAGLLRNATPEGNISTTKDWSFLAEKHYGPNWFLVGESAGFADPILSAGLTVTQGCARELAYTIVALEEGKLDPEWLKVQFQHNQALRVRNHIRFADYWYCANTQFSELKEFTAVLARDSGLDLSPDEAWRWLAQGGFVHEGGKIGTGGFDFAAVQQLTKFLSGQKPTQVFSKYNVFTLDLSDARHEDSAYYENGKIIRLQTYIRGDRILPIGAPTELMINILQRESKLSEIVARIRQVAEPLRARPEKRAKLIHTAVQALEALVEDGWVKPSFDPASPLQDLNF